MSLRSFILRFVSDDFRKKAETESRAWVASCKHCGKQTSIWDIGGIRYGSQTRATTRVKCPSCGKIGLFTFTKPGA